jgi:primase-polymerase (primpol)-like protein
MGGPKPADYTPPNFDAVPSLLQAPANWTIWDYLRRRDGRWGKPPLQVDGRKARVNDASTWASFSQVRVAFETACRNGRPFDGISFILPHDRICGWDFDNVLDANLKVINQDVADIVDLLDNYTELSPGRRGLRLFTLGHLPPGPRKKAEMRISRTLLSCLLHREGYETYRAGSAFGVRLGRRTRYLLNSPSSS